MSIVAAIDFSDYSAQVVRAAAREARRREMSLVVLHCVEVGGGGILGTSEEQVRVDDQMREDALDELERAVDDALDTDDRPATLEFDVTVTGPEEGIVDIAAARGATLVVVGRSEQGGIGAVVWSTTSEQLVRSADQPIMVVPPTWQADDVDRVLVPVTDSAEGHRSVELAADFARREGRNVKLMHVVNTGPTSTLGRDIPPSDERLASMKNDAVTMMRELATDVDFGDADLEMTSTICPLEAAGIHEVILEEAEAWGADRVFMVTRGHEGLRRWLEGSVTSEVIHRATIPVVVANLDND